MSLVSNCTTLALQSYLEDMRGRVMNIRKVLCHDMTRIDHDDAQICRYENSLREIDDAIASLNCAMQRASRVIDRVDKIIENQLDELTTQLDGIYEEALLDATSIEQFVVEDTEIRNDGMVALSPV